MEQPNTGNQNPQNAGGEDGGADPNANQEPGTPTPEQEQDINYWKEQSKQQSARARRAEEKQKEFEEKQKQTPPEAPSEPKKQEEEPPASKPPEQSEQEWRERMELKVDGYSQEEIDFIIQSGGKKAVENEFVQQAITAMRDKAKRENSTPAPSGRGGGSSDQQPETSQEFTERLQKKEVSRDEFLAHQAQIAAQKKQNRFNT